MARLFRAFGYGFLSVILAIYLNALGYDAIRIGFVLTTTLVGSTVFTAIATFFERRIGRKRLLLGFAGMMSVAASIFAFTSNFIALLFAAMIGTINVTANEAGHFLALDQAIIPDAVDSRRRTLAFAVYGTGGTLTSSAGALLGGVPTLLQGQGFSRVDSFRPMFLLYVLLGIMTFVAYSLLSPNAEVSRKEQGTGNFLSGKTRGIVLKLSAILAVDTFGAGFVVNSLISYWFFIQFNAPLESISLIFFVGGLLSAGSFLAAARIASAIGLVKTMAVTQVISNTLLILMPFAPSVQVAAVLYWGRIGTSLMDTPTRQSYVVAVVKPEERVAAAGLINISRNVAQSASPSLSTYALQMVSLSFPFFIGGAVKILYASLLYAGFRRLKPPEEQSPPAAQTDQRRQ